MDTPNAPAPYTNADYIQHLAGTPGAAPPPAAPTPGPATPAVPEVGSLMAQGVSAAQLKSALDYEVAGGRLSRSEADAMLAEELGVSPSAVRAAGAEGQCEVTSWLADQGFTPAKHEEWTLPKFPGSDTASPADLLALDTQVRDILTQAKLPLGIGQYLVGEIARSAEVYGALDERSKDLLRHEARAQLQRIWGDETREMLEGASDLAHELERRCPGFFDLMDETGAGDNVRVLVQLGEHARRLRAGLAEREARSARR